jgi:hypothetical protein
MKKAIIICLLLASVGCTTVPVAQKFPSAPDRLLQSCEKLITINTDTIEFSEFTKTVTQNYTLSRQCDIKNEGWIEWYNTQKQIFDNVQ